MPDASEASWAQGFWAPPGKLLELHEKQVAMGGWVPRGYSHAEGILLGFYGLWSLMFHDVVVTVAEEPNPQNL